MPTTVQPPRVAVNSTDISQMAAADPRLELGIARS